jgi:hypothetical protein
VKVTEIPEQIVVAVADIETLGVTGGLTITLRNAGSGGLIHPNKGVNVRVAVPLNPRGGVHDEFGSVGSKKLPPTSSDHRATTVPFTIAAPRFGT